MPDSTPHEPKVTVLTEDYWPKLKQAVKNIPEGESYELEVECPICYEVMEFEPVEERTVHCSESDVDAMPHRAAVTCCGHMFGMKCIANYIFNASPEKAPCPRCREPLCYPECPHRRNLLGVPHADILHFPWAPTRDEAGSRLPERCARCEVFSALGGVAQEVWELDTAGQENPGTPAKADRVRGVSAWLCCNAGYASAPVEVHIGPGGLNLARRGFRVAETIPSNDDCQAKRLLCEAQRDLIARLDGSWHNVDYTKLDPKLHVYSKDSWES